MSLPGRETLLQQARDLRAAGRAAEALPVLEQLEAHHPSFSRLFQERAHCHVVLRNAPAAMVALHQALRLNQTLPAAWDMLAQLLRMAGDAAGAEAAQRNLAILRQMPVEIVAGSSLQADGDLDQAADVLRGYLARDPANPGALRLLGRILLDSGAADEAEALLARALRRAPDWDEARLDYAMALLEQQKHAAARAEAEQLLQSDPHSRDYRKQYAAACIGLGDHDRVIDIYAALLAEIPAAGPEAAELRLWRANALKAVGRTEEAIADYRASAAAGGGGVVWFSLANLKTYRFSDTEVARIEAEAVRPDLPEMERVYLAFALGKAHEDRADHAAAWAAYDRGNGLRRAMGRWRADVAEAAAQRIAAAQGPALFSVRREAGHPAHDPIFVVSLPRSGSTLVEQILASHPDIEGTQELPFIGRIAAELMGADPDCALPLRPEALARLTPAQCRELGARYLGEAGAHRHLGRKRFIDKMPSNLWHLGLIRQILPNATVIDVRRHPMACGFANWKQLFGTGHHEFAYGAEDIGRYYRSYLALTRHWESALPVSALRLHYEDLVENLEAEVRRLLDHCGLPFDPACLEFHRTQRTVRTPSSEQVRRPLGRNGLDQWRAFAPWLGPLEDALGDAVTTWRT